MMGCGCSLNFQKHTCRLHCLHTCPGAFTVFLLWMKRIVCWSLVLSSSTLSRRGSWGQQPKHRCPDFSSLPRHFLQHFRKYSEALQGQSRRVLVLPQGSSWWDMPGTPTKRGVQGASKTDSQVTSADFF